MFQLIDSKYFLGENQTKKMPKYNWINTICIIEKRKIRENYYRGRNFLD